MSFFDVYENNTNLGRIATTSFVVNGINDLSDTLHSSISFLGAAMGSALNFKADQTYVDASLNLKANQTYVDASLNNINGSITYLLNNSGSSVTKTYVDNSINLVYSALSQKANQSSLTSINNSISSINGSISTIDASLNLLPTKAYVDGSLNSINGAISIIDASINTLFSDISGLSGGGSSSSGITLDDAVLQIEIEGMRDLPLFAQNWQQNTSINYTLRGANSSNSIATSGNGQYIFVGLQGTSVANTVPQLSKDYGNTWSDVSPPFGQTFENPTAAAINATGQYMIAINTPNGASTSSGIFLSSDYGSTWTRGPSSGTSTDSVAISSTGKYMLSATSVYLSISDNYGKPKPDNTSSWYNGTSLNIDLSNNNFRGKFHGVAMSHDGSVMYSTTHYRVWKSTDYGKNWAQSNGTGANYGHISCSANGKYVLICPYQVAGDVSNNVFVSSDYGVTFTAKGDIHSFYQGSVSACGRYMIATDGGRYSGPMTYRKGYVYASDDYGQTWIQVTGTAGYYTGVTMNHSGSMIYAQSATLYGDNGHLYVNNTNYTPCIQTSQPYGSVPGGTIYYDQSNNKLQIYNGKSSAWYSIGFTPS
jgi:hypothetical protein